MDAVTTFALGIDGGGTTTRAALVDPDGRVLGVGEASGANVHDHGALGAARAIRAAAQEALADAQLPSSARPRTACLALAGVVTGADRALARTAGERSGVLDPTAPLLIHHDGAAAVAGAHLGSAGAVLIAGTGSACYARDAAGSVHRIGGWGWLLGDEGSGGWLGREALVAVAHAADGRGPATTLAAPLLLTLGCATADDLLHRVYVTGLDRAGFAALAPTVLAHAAEGDPVAEELVARGVDALAGCAIAALRTIREPTAPIALVGGIATHPQVTARIAARLTERACAGAIVPAACPPVLGAAALALAALTPPTHAVWHALRRSAAAMATRRGGSLA